MTANRTDLGKRFVREILQCYQLEADKSEGYTPGVDIWSVGCVAATLLTGQLLFPADVDPALGSRADSCEERLTEQMEREASWSGVSRMAKSFIRQCVSLRESKRLTAGAALSHAWFTNQAYAAELDQVYERAVHEWRQIDHHECVVEYIDTTETLQSLIMRTCSSRDHAKTT